MVIVSEIEHEEACTGLCWTCHAIQIDVANGFRILEIFLVRTGACYADEGTFQILPSDSPTWVASVLAAKDVSHDHGMGDTDLLEFSQIQERPLVIARHRHHGRPQRWHRN